MSIENALQKSMSNVPECVAAGYVDMATGMLLGVKTVDSHPQEVLDLVSAATADLFQGNNVVAIEQLFKKARGVKDDNHYFHEIIVFSENLLHSFMRCKKNPDHAVVWVCRKNANIGMVIAKTRMSLGSIEDAI